MLAASRMPFFRQSMSIQNRVDRPSQCLGRDMEMALRDLSVSSMKHPALAKESASYTTLEMPSDIVIIPVRHISCASPPDSCIPAHNAGSPAASGLCRQADDVPPSASADLQNGSTSQVSV